MLTKSLYFSEGSSDKEYHVRVEPSSGQFVVNVAYGRRGSTLQTLTKTASPVDLETATRIFTKLVREKEAKGYQEGTEGGGYTVPPVIEEQTNVHCQLLNPIEENEVEALILNEDWCAQEKYDGRRVLIRKRGLTIIGINRRGLEIGLPSELFTAASQFDSDFLMDGECVGTAFYAFDLLEVGGRDLRKERLDTRMCELMNLLASKQQRSIAYADTAWDTASKRRLLRSLKEQNKEGIVFKLKTSPYTSGRPHSGGAQLKHKFYGTVSAVVTGINQQRSVEIKLLNEEGWQAAGNVTIPSNHEIPPVGQVVEVRYLYAFPESGSLFQPTYLGVRNDITQFDCTQKQLKFKRQE